MIASYITAHWVEWLFAAATFILGFLYRQTAKRLKEEQKRNKAVADGVQCLLRESIVANYNKYHERDFCPIYAKESIKKAYDAYHSLGGNDVATQLFNTLLKMPEEPEEREENHEKENRNRNHCENCGTGVCAHQSGADNQRVQSAAVHR